MNIDPLLKAREVCAILQISAPSLYRRVKEGRLPPPLKLGSSSRWAKSEIDLAIEQAKGCRHAT